jgi:tRNA dimethylallyltransferase
MDSTDKMTHIYKLVEDFVNSPSEKKIIVILGPTASGKTSLSINIARQFNGEVISTDSRQVYRFMDIGTAKIKPKETEGIKHYMIDVVNPDQQFTLADFVDQAKKAIDEIHKKGKIPIITGGTGLYIRAICDNYKIPRIEPDYALRQKLQEEVAQHGSEYIHDKLKKIDPETAEKIHPNNTRYVIRAIEINKAIGDKKQDLKEKPIYDVLKIGITMDREKLYDRINRRVYDQIDEGLVNETKTLLQKGYSEKLPSMSSLGYPEMLKYINGELMLEEAIELLQINTRHYAKRQLTWFSKEKDIYWLEV